LASESSQKSYFMCNAIPYMTRIFLGALLAAVAVFTLSGCADNSGQVLSRLPDEAPVTRQLDPADKLRRADRIDRQVMQDQREALRTESALRHGGTSIIVDHDQE
jgi:hypothetical protein